MKSSPFSDIPAMTEEELMDCIERAALLPEEEADWVTQVLLECRRARSALETLEAGKAESESMDYVSANLTQVVLDTTEWLRTLWEVGYMGAGTLPVPPRTHFPQIEVEDVLKSVLFSRIRHGKLPLPFAPPTRWGSPWHEIVETLDPQSVDASLIEDDGEAAFVMVDGCNRWHIVRAEDSKTYIIQHENKGPLYRLRLDRPMSTLQRMPPGLRCAIRSRLRAGLSHFVLEWKNAHGAVEEVHLRAATRDGAEAAAHAWIARHHPQQYGQVSFEHV